MQQEQEAADFVRACEDVFAEAEDKSALTTKDFLALVAKRLGRDNVDSAKELIRATLLELAASNEPASQDTVASGQGEAAAAENPKTEEDEESSLDEVEPSPSKGGKHRGWNKPMRLSPELAAVIGTDIDTNLDARNMFFAGQ